MAIMNYSVNMCQMSLHTDFHIVVVYIYTTTPQQNVFSQSQKPIKPNNILKFCLLVSDKAVFIFLHCSKAAI